MIKVVFNVKQPEFGHRCLEPNANHNMQLKQRWKRLIKLNKNKKSLLTGKKYVSFTRKRGCNSIQFILYIA